LNKNKIKSCLISLECGTDTRVFVSKVMTYANSVKKEDVFDDELFQKINLLNTKIINLFLNNEDNILSNIFTEKLTKYCKKLRKNIKQLSINSGVEIEPDIITGIIDLLLDKGIMFAICPGGKLYIYFLNLAGGYDGIFVMGIIDNFFDIIEEVTDNFNENNSDFKAYIIKIDLDSEGTKIIKT
jgi:hypothetical protein